MTVTRAEVEAMVGKRVVVAEQGGMLVQGVLHGVGPMLDPPFTEVDSFLGVDIGRSLVSWDGESTFEEWGDVTLAIFDIESIREGWS